MQKSNEIKQTIIKWMKMIFDVLKDYIWCTVGYFALLGIDCNFETNEFYHYFPYDMSGIFNMLIYAGGIYITFFILRNIFELMEYFYKKINASILWNLFSYIAGISKYIFILTVGIFAFIGFQFINMQIDGIVSLEKVFQLMLIILLIVEAIKYFFIAVKELIKLIMEYRKSRKE